jgi:hypothetical protein
MLLAVAILLMGQDWLRGEAFVVDYGRGEQKLPEWLRLKSEVAPAGGLAMAMFEVAPGGAGGDVLVSLLFTETEGGFLRVFWESPTAALTVAENLQEGIDMPNRRRLLLRESLLRDGGTLTVQSSRAVWPVGKIKWEVLAPRTVLADADGERAAVLVNEELLTAAEVGGGTVLPTADRWQGPVVTAELTEKAERIEDGAVFEFALESAPLLARLECQVNGLPVGKALTLRVNGERAGELSVQVPDLTDEAYGAGADGAVVYQGWRRAAALVTAELLRAGVNDLRFTVSGEELGKFPLAVKAVRWQLKYPQLLETTTEKNDENQ